MSTIAIKFIFWSFPLVRLPSGCRGGGCSWCGGGAWCRLTYSLSTTNHSIYICSVYRSTVTREFRFPCGNGSWTSCSSVSMSVFLPWWFMFLWILLTCITICPMPPYSQACRGCLCRSPVLSTSSVLHTLFDIGPCLQMTQSGLDVLRQFSKTFIQFFQWQTLGTLVNDSHLACH